MLYIFIYILYVLLLYGNIGINITYYAYVIIYINFENILLCDCII